MLATMQSGFTFACNHLLDPVRLGYQVAESASVTYQSSSPQRFEQLHRIRKVFIVATGILAAIDYIQLLSNLENKWGVLSFFMINKDPRGAQLPIVAIGGAIFGVAYLVTHYVGKYFSPTTDLKQKTDAIRERNDISVTWERPWLQEANHWIIGSRIILNIALACFAANPYFYLASAGLQLYSLSQTMRWNWLRYDQTFARPKSLATMKIEDNDPITFAGEVLKNEEDNDKIIGLFLEESESTILLTQGEDQPLSITLFRADGTPHSVPVTIADNQLTIPGGYAEHRFKVIATALHNDLTKITISYFRPMLPASGHKNENCLPCMGENPQTLACGQHAQHDECIVGSIYADMERFNEINLGMWDKHVSLSKVPVIYENKNGLPTHVQYSFNFSRAALPRCTDCRSQPGYGEIEISTEDQGFPGQCTEANVTLI